jgi:hypothetical protein
MALLKYLEEHGSDIAGCVWKGGLAMAGVWFIQACGLGHEAVELIKAILLHQK